MSQSDNGLNLGQLKFQAKELVRAIRAGSPSAIERVLPYFSSSDKFTLASAQLVIARENGFDSWPRLRRAFEPAGETREPSLSQLLFEALDAKNDAAAMDLITQHPELAGVWRRTEHGWENPLNVAAENGRLGPARALVDAGVALYTVNQGDYPPVFNAASAGHKEMTDYLLAASASSDLGLPPTFGCGIDIVLASRLGMLDRVRMHVERDPMAVFRRGCIGETVLHWPAHDGEVEVVRYLLDNGALIGADEIGLYGGKPLHWAAEHSPACVALLLERGADPNCRNMKQNDFKGYTPLHMWARQREQNIECAQLLLDAGADPHQVAAKGQTPLDVAVERGRERCKEFLAGL